MKQQHVGSGQHPIQVAARRTGLTPEVLRAWEKRYGVVEPQRTPTGRRFYTDEDLERLRLLRDVTRGGRRIGDVAGFTSEELIRILHEDLAENTAVPPQGVRPRVPLEESLLLSELLESVRTLDASRMDQLLSRARLDMRSTDLLEQVIGPFVQRIGALWEQGQLDIYHEHFATSIIRRFLCGMIAEGPVRPSSPSILVTTPSGHVHELGALIVAGLAAAQGWRVTYVGSNLPAGDIIAAAAARDARAVAVSLVYPEGDADVGEQLRELARGLPSKVRLLAGGRAAASYSNILDSIDARVIRDTREFCEVLDRLG